MLLARHSKRCNSPRLYDNPLNMSMEVSPLCSQSWDTSQEEVSTCTTGSCTHWRKPGFPGQPSRQLHLHLLQTAHGGPLPPL